MINRCTNPNVPAYKSYAGRGIMVCERWRKFENFLEDMGECHPKMSIERIDNNLGYSKDNCKWATATEQSRNRRSNIVLTFRGKTKCAEEWGIELGIGANAIRRRIHSGWDVERALTTPAKPRNRQE